jgi:hypothetical protein
MVNGVDELDVRGEIVVEEGEDEEEEEEEEGEGVEAAEDDEMFEDVEAEEELATDAESAIILGGG